MQIKRKKLTQKLGINLELFSNKHKNITKKTLTKYSLFKRELIERQKIRATYQIANSTLKTIVKRLKHTQDKLIAIIKLLEKRLDNVLFRAQICATRRAAQQLIAHKKIKLNGKRETQKAKLIAKNDIIKSPYITNNTSKYFAVFGKKCKVLRTDYYKKYIKQYNKFLLTKTLN
ncbi:hypothetical protein JS520_00775 [Candidatus Vidania fulgoroideae]|nr:hypothetical protein JS520_00775 [Candidatus Vidania fulgoroideae]